MFEFPALSEIALALGLTLLVAVAMFVPESKRFKTIYGATLLILLGTLLIQIFGGTGVAFNDQFIQDEFSRVLKCAVLVASFAALVLGRDFLERDNLDRFEYPLLGGFAVLGMLVMISANDLMSLYIGLELQSLSLYVLTAIARDDARAGEAGLKYFVLGVLASGLFLYGASLIYGFTGATGFEAIAQNLISTTEGSGAHPGYGLLTGLVFVLVAMVFKVSATPFHMWTPDVYEGAPTPVVTFLATAPKLAAIALLTRLLVGPFGDIVDQWQQVLIVVSALSMIWGGIAGITQHNLKRLMAYSSIANIGFALMGLAAGSVKGVEATIFYMIIYAIAVLGTFGCLVMLRRAGVAVEAISDLAGYGYSHPRMAAALLIFMFSMAGIPPLAGFFAKYYVFTAAIDAGLLTLAIIGALSSVAGAYYYLRIVKVMYFDSADIALDRAGKGAAAFVVGLAVLVTAGFVLYPALLTLPAAQAANSLF